MTALRLTQEAVSDHMDAILRLFKPGAKIAVIVRSPGHPDRDFLMTNDEGKEIAALIRRRFGATVEGE